MGKRRRCAAQFRRAHDQQYLYASDVYAADLDRDDDMDVLGAASMWEGAIVWWENDGSASFAEHLIGSAFPGARSIYAADVDGDGNLDILGAAFDANQIAWWENLGGTPPGFLEHLICEDCDGVWSVYAADVHGDADVDVLGASAYARHIDWWENMGGIPPNFSRHVIRDNFDGASCVYVNDVDTDGDIDVLGSAYWGGEIAWWENMRNFSISSPTHPQTLMPGNSASFEIDLQTENPRGFVPVTLNATGLPAGVTGELAPNPVTPPDDSVFTVATNISSPIGTHVLTITGTTGDFTHSTTVTLQIKGFTIYSSTPWQVALRGRSARFELTLTSWHGFNEPVTMSVTGLPDGVTANFTPNPVTPSDSSIMTVTTKDTTPPGIYDLEVIGTSPSLSRTTIVILQVVKRMKIYVPLVLRNNP